MKEYLGDMAGQLALLAGESGYDVLAHIFRMAELEASPQPRVDGTTIVPPYSVMKVSAADASEKHHLI
ncbi:MAG TPA: hypothetical protein VNR39_12385 [Pseudolabrys sp.]|nr:hypothetical protein [Pseudolabrys sp.]